MNDTALEQSEESSSSHSSGNIPISIGAMLVTLGVVYGDIGTSPMLSHSKSAGAKNLSF